MSVIYAIDIVLPTYNKYNKYIYVDITLYVYLYE